MQFLRKAFRIPYKWLNFSWRRCSRIRRPQISNELFPSFDVGETPIAQNTRPNKHIKSGCALKMYGTQISTNAYVGVISNEKLFIRQITTIRVKDDAHVQKGTYKRRRSNSSNPSVYSRAPNAYLVYYTRPKIKWPHMQRTQSRFQGRAMVSRESLAYPEDTILHLLYRAVKNGRHGILWYWNIYRQRHLKTKDSSIYNQN